MNGAYKLATVAGIDIGVHYTWLFAFALITWTLAGSWFPSDYPDWAETTYWVTAAVASLLLFGSILVHELAHSLVAIARGMPVRSITLFIFGGVSDIGGDTNSARDEFQIAIVGPASSLLLSAAGFLALRAGIGGDDSPVEAILIYFTLMNFLVGVFNLLPGFPLDGGRVLRSIVWASTGDNARATDISTSVGIGFGWLLVAAGVLTAITGDVISGLWLGFVGWYLKDSATAVRRGNRQTLADVSVRTVMKAPEAPVHPDASISMLVDEYMVPFGRRSVPVVDGDRIVGIITLHDLEGLNRNLWGVTPVSTAMTVPPLLAVGPDDSLLIAFQILAQYNVNQILVIESDLLVGIIRRTDLMRMIAMDQ